MTSYEVRVKNRKAIGPLPADLIVRGLELRRVPFEAQVREEGTAEWVPLASIDEFYAAMGLDDAQTNQRQRPVFDATDETDEATRVLSSLWADHPPPGPVNSRPGGRPARLPPVPALPPAPAPPGAPSRGHPPLNYHQQSSAKPAPAHTPTKATPSGQHLAEAGSYEAPTEVFDRFDVTRHGAPRPARLGGSPLPPVPLPPIPSLPPATGQRPLAGPPPARRASQPSPNYPPGKAPSVPPAPPPARSPMLTPSPAADTLMDADEDDDDVRVVREVPSTPPAEKPSYSVRPAAGAPARPSQGPPRYRPDHPDELTAPARRLVIEQERTRRALAWVSAALGVVLLVLLAVLLLR